MESLTLETGRLSVSLVPAFGARIISLVDKRTGRDWIAAGPCAGSADDDAVFGPRVATGWDECFPTVGPCLSSHGTVLRDHGDLWGRAWRVTEASGGNATMAFQQPSYRFERTLELTDDILLCRYRVDNLADRPLEFLWAMHALFALTPNDRIELPAGARGQVRFRNDGRKTGAITWPQGAEFPLDRVQPTDRRFAAKLLFDNAPNAGVRIGTADGSLLITAERRYAGSTGIWLCYGGWPGADAVHQVAIEPTTAPADDLATARAMGRGVIVSPGQSVNWWTKVTAGRGLRAAAPGVDAADGEF